MRTLRIYLLALLAVLLPIRGALAAAMLCPPAGGAAHSLVATAVPAMDDHDMAPADHDAHAHAHADHHQADSDPAEAQSSSGHHEGLGKCNLCCSVCSMTPLVSTLSPVATPGSPSAVSFPGLSAPAPIFLSDGQERPPRIT